MKMADKPALRAGALPYAQFLGLGDAAKSLPAKASAAVSRVLRKTPTASREIPALSNVPSSIATSPAPGPSVATQIDQAVKAANERAARILAAGVKAGRVHQACSLAFDTNLPTRAALAALDAAALDEASIDPHRTGLADRMAAVQVPNPGAGGGASPSANPAKAMADRIVAVADRVFTQKQRSRPSRPEGGQTSTAGGAYPASNCSQSIADRIVAAAARAEGDA